jgi:uncharacterized protein (DUF362 family)
MNRREWLAMVAATPLLRAAPQLQGSAKPAPVSPVAIARAATYNSQEVTAAVATMFKQLGGIEKLVANKTVVIKLNLTGTPTDRKDNLSPGLTHWVHPSVCGAVTSLIGKAGAKRIRIVESRGRGATELLEDYVAAGDWDVKAIRNAAKNVEFENTAGLGFGKKYARMPVGPGAYMFPAWDMNHSYEENDVFVTIGKMKNHGVAGITLSMKNLFGCLPLSIYGNDAGVDEPNEHPTANRSAVGHTGKRAPSKCSPGELNFGTNNDGGYRMPRIVVDLVAARPVHLAIIDGIESIAGSELPRNVNLAKPNVLIAGFNPVCTDAVGCAVMGYNPRATRGDPGFPRSDNQFVLAEQRGLGSTDLKHIDIRGLPLEKALYYYESVRPRQTLPQPGQPGK